MADVEAMWVCNVYRVSSKVVVAAKQPTECLIDMRSKQSVDDPSINNVAARCSLIMITTMMIEAASGHSISLHNF